MGENRAKTDIPSPLSESRAECAQLRAKLEIAESTVSELTEIRTALILCCANLSAVLSRPVP